MRIHTFDNSVVFWVSNISTFLVWVLTIREMPSSKPRKRRRDAPPAAPLFDEDGLRRFVEANDASPERIVPVVYRVATRGEYNLPVPAKLLLLLLLLLDMLAPWWI